MRSARTVCRRSRQSTELAEPLKEVLDETYGLIVYQEQVQSAARILAGYSLGKADVLRRAMGKKKPEVLAKEKIPFFAGMKEHGYSEEAAQAVWDILVPFSGYAFNKAHSAAYGLISYWTAYLKTHYPVEFMAALLQGASTNKDKTALYLGEARRMGIQVLSPDVNESVYEYSAVATSCDSASAPSATSARTRSMRSSRNVRTATAST